MPVPTLITDLDPVAANNSPAGGDAVFPDLDNFLRIYGACIAQLRDGTGLADGAITLAKLAAGILSADAAGRLKMADEFVTKVKLATSVQQSLTPTGAVLSFPATVAPAGFLKASGALVNRADYPDLWAYAQVSGNLHSEADWTASRWGGFSVGNGSTTFRLPRLNGETVRGWDDGAGIDAGRLIGESQGDQNRDHTHTGTTSTDGEHRHFFEARPDQNVDDGGAAGGGGSVSATVYTSFEGAHSHTFTTASSGGTEVRVRNVALLYCIKT